MNLKDEYKKETTFDVGYVLDVNELHYDEHYVEWLEAKINFIDSSQQLKDFKKISFEQYKNFIYIKDGYTYINKETMMPMDLEGVGNRYRWHLQNL